jgi:peptidoglycan/xylan/chitin deacetylase (PgdA/CDA1 family)
MTKANVAAARMYAERNMLATLHRAVPRNGGRILCYHAVGQREWGVNDISPAHFRKQLEFALNAGFRFLPATEIAASGGGANDLAITFDDAVKSVASTAAPILAEYGIPWSVFVVSSWADQQSDWARSCVLGWRELEQLARAGADIGSHSVTHADFGKLERSRIAEELGASRLAIQEHLGVAASTFAIPFGQSANWSDFADSAARAVGYDVIYAQAERTRPPGTIARTFVTHFDHERIFHALLRGAFDSWEEWVP